jgi:hypothetical protein
MVMWEGMLKHLPAECPQVDYEEHRTRYRTLQAIARQYAEAPAHFGIVNVWRPKRPGLPTPDRIGEMVQLSRIAPAMTSQNG